MNPKRPPKRQARACLERPSPAARTGPPGAAQARRARPYHAREPERGAAIAPMIARDGEGCDDRHRLATGMAAAIAIAIAIAAGSVYLPKRPWASLRHAFLASPAKVSHFSFATA